MIATRVFFLFCSLASVQISLAQTKASKNNLLISADSLFQLQQWKPAKEKYQQYLTDTVTSALAWNRLGYCEQQLGIFNDAVVNYKKALTFNPPNVLKYTIEMRLARSYACLKNEKETIGWLDKAVESGYQDINEIDRLKEFDMIRQDQAFKISYQKIYQKAYPCSADPKQREFDFWVGEWNVFQNGTTQLVGHSLVQKCAGECALLENWTASRGASTGKSLNYFDAANNTWEQDWIGSIGGGQRFLHDIYTDSAMRFTYETITNDKKVTGNFIFYNMGKDKVRQYQDASEDGGKTFTVSYDFIYIRKK